MSDGNGVSSGILTLREKIVAAMHDRRWNQTDLARASGLGAHTISRIVTGATAISPHAERQISEAFGWSIPAAGSGRTHCRPGEFPKEFATKRLPNGYSEVTF
jgi:transcriptional regulator with XRE-family HTH domain